MRIERRILFVLWTLTIALGSTVYAQTNDPNCGNPPQPPKPPAPPEEGGCDDKNSAGANPFNPYSGVVQRQVTDLKSSVQVGEQSMDFTRSMVSRLDPAIKVDFDSPFGDAGNWRHSFQWDILYNTNDIGAEKIRIIYPDGRWGNFDFDDGNAAHMTFLASTQERVLKQGTNYYLIFIDGTRHHFTRDDSGDTPVYQMQSTYDPYSNRTEYVYSSNLLSEVRGPNTNQTLRFNYETLPNSVPSGSIEFSFTDNTATNVELRGSFTGWSGTPMVQSNGIWTATVNLTNGWHSYKFTARYSGDTNTYWFSDPDNDMWTYPDSNSVAVVDPYRLLSSVESSDGRTVSYQYDWSCGGGMINLMLTNVAYGTSGLNAEYTYYPASNDLWRTVLLHTADDPMYDGPARALEYIYQTNNIYSGRIYQERSLATGRLLSELTMSADTNNPYARRVTDADGNVSETIHAEESGNVASRTNAVGQATANEYYGGNGMLKKRTDAMGRTTEYTRTLHFGVPAIISNSVKGVRTIQYTDYTYPFYKLEMVDELGRTNKWERDSQHRVVKQIDPSGDFETFAYNEQGQVTTNTLRDGVSKRITTYDSKGRKIAETDPSGATTTYGYDTNDRLAAETNALGHATSYQYDWRGSVTNILYPDGTSEQFFYNRAGQATQEVSRAGAVTLRTYDELGYPHSVIDALGHETIFSYNGEGRLITTEKPSGLIISNSYDAIGRKIRETYSSDETYNEWAYSPDGVVSNRNRLGHWTQITYDSGGYLQSIIDPEGHATFYTHCILGARITSITNALGEGVRYGYDIEGMRISTEDDVGIVFTNTYDALGRLVTSVSYGTLTNAYTYDPMDRTTAIHLNGSLVQSNHYDAVGRPIWSRNADGLVISNTYDSAGLLLKSYLPDGTYMENVYSNTFLVEQKDRAGRATRYQHDGLGRITNVTDNASNTVSYAYDISGSMTNLIDRAGNSTRWMYDQEERLTRKTYDDSSFISYGYNAAGLLVTRTNARSQITHYDYDKTSRRIQTDYETDTDIITQYDALGRITNVTDTAGQTAYTYSPGRSLLTQVDGPLANDTLVYSYDSASRLTNMAWGVYTAGYSYDDLNRIATVMGSEGMSTYEYLANGTAISQLDCANGTESLYGYDPLMRLTNLVHRTFAQGVISSFAYAYNNADQRTRVSMDNGHYTDYGYDEIGQLLSADGSMSDGSLKPGASFEYLYDTAGNPTWQDRNGFQLTNTFNALNQNVDSEWSGTLTMLGSANTHQGTVVVNSNTATLFADGTFAATNLNVQAGTNSFQAVITDPFGRAATNAISVTVSDRQYAYDADGNLTNDAKRIYVYNNENRLVEVREASSDDLLMSCLYDSQGQRRQRITYDGGVGTTNRYVYHGWQVIGVLDGEDNVIETYTHGPDLSGTVGGSGGIGGILACTVYEGGTNEYVYHCDAQGNVINVTDDSEASVASCTYSPFGQLLTQAGDFTPRYAFSSKEYDYITGLYYYSFRHYSPQLNRWLSKDPIGISGGLNLYAFCGNNPVNFVDPHGLLSGKNKEKASDAIREEGARNGIDVSKDVADSLAGEMGIREGLKLKNPKTPEDVKEKIMEKITERVKGDKKIPQDIKDMLDELAEKAKEKKCSE